MFLRIALPLLAVVFAVADAGLVGGISNADVSNPAAKEALRFAVAKYNTNSNDEFVSDVTKVISSTKQVVAGLLFKFEVEMSRTQCRKGGQENICAVHSDPDIAKPTICHFEVWTKPWEKFTDVQKSICRV